MSYSNDVIARNNPVLVIDNGTGYTKMGYAGNNEPNYIIPTCISHNPKSTETGLTDLDFYIGHEAQEKTGGNYDLVYPMRHGLIEDWNKMEMLWEQCFFNYLKCEPEDHYLMLTEPPLNPPENRESTAEIMFETFNVSGLYIAVQAVLALCASWTSTKSKKLGLGGTLSGTVIDSGDGVTHVIPVVEGYVIGSSIKHIPLAGRDVTEFLMRFIMDREKNMPSEDIKLAVQKIKEKYCYVCSDLAKEFNKFDTAPLENILKYSQENKRSGKWEIDIAYERFLAPEVFFNPEIFTETFSTPLPDVVDQCIQTSPIDARRSLYKNIVLSGGSTMFEHFDRRLQRDLKKRLDERYERAVSMTSSGKAKPSPLECNVIAHNHQRFAVWFGGSMLGTMNEFKRVCYTKAQYDEMGPSIARRSQVFQNFV